MPAPAALLELIQALGLPMALFVLIVYGGAREIWVYGWVYRRERERADRFEALSLELLQTARTAVRAAERAQKPPGTK